MRNGVDDDIAQNVRELERVAEGFGEEFCALVFESENVNRDKPDRARDAVAVFADILESPEIRAFCVGQNSVDNVENVLLGNAAAGYYPAHFLGERREVFFVAVDFFHFVPPREQLRLALGDGARFLVGDVVHKAAEGVENFHILGAVFFHAKEREGEVRLFALGGVVAAFGRLAFGVRHTSDFRRILILSAVEM